MCAQDEDNISQPDEPRMLQRPAQSVQALPARKLLWFKLDGQAGAAQHVQIGTDVQITRELTVAMRQGTSQHADCRCTIAVDAVSSHGGSSTMTFHSGLQVKAHTRLVEAYHHTRLVEASTKGVYSTC